MNISDVLIEAIKILGPSSITAFVTYKALALKLKEIDKASELKVRERLFDYYVDRSKENTKRRDEINTSIGALIGFIGGLGKEAEGDVKKFTETMSKVTRNFARNAPKDVRRTKKEMERGELTDLPEFGELDLCFSKINKLENKDELTALQNDLIVLLDVYHTLNDCQQLLLDKHRDEIFMPYLKVVKE